MRIARHITTLVLLVPTLAQDTLPTDADIVPDSYLSLPLSALQYEGEAPGELNRVLSRRDGARPGVAFDTDAQPLEAHVAYPTGDSVRLADVVLSVQVEPGAPLRGTLIFPGAGDEELRARFAIDTKGATAEGRLDFVRSVYLVNRDLWRRGLPGGAWFRHRMDAAARELERTGSELPADAEAPRRAGRRRPEGLDDAYDLMTGGRALAENLQLDRVLEPEEGPSGWKSLTEIEGITTREFDWSPLVEGIGPELDALAAVLPADQHAVFFPTFGALTELTDELRKSGAPVLELFEARAEDSGTKARYERQLCLELDDLSRMFGGMLVRSVAISGSDPYLRTGSDVAVLFETEAHDALSAALLAKLERAVDAHPEAELVAGEVLDIEYQGVVEPRRSICAYQARVGDALVVTNSLAQLFVLAECAAGRRTPLAELDEYRFFRSRYARDAGVFVILTDATIRRWCSPEWRIGAARRTRAAALLAEATAQALAEGSGVTTPARARLIADDARIPGGGPVRRTQSGIRSETYGTSDFLTPIRELEIERVTLDEAEAYDRWRNTYQNRWRRFFDPIAASLDVSAGRVELDLSVLPLIDATDYRDLVRLTEGATLRGGALQNEAALLEFAFAFDPSSSLFRDAAGMAQTIAPALSNPLGWMAGEVVFYLEQSPFWAQAAEAGIEAHLRDHPFQMPLGMRVPSKDPLRMAGFLGAMRGFMTDSAPGLVRWETRKHEERAYVCILPEGLSAMLGDPLEVYYVTYPDALILALREDVITHEIDRRAAEGAEIAPPWRGESLALRASAASGDLARAWWSDSRTSALQQTSWNALPILNELRRLFPDRDPVEFHTEHFGVRLVCPGGGQYVWDAAWQTMASSAFGHPGAPRANVSEPDALVRLRAIDCGVTFEHDGLRAVIAVDREP